MTDPLESVQIKVEDCLTDHSPSSFRWQIMIKENKKSIIKENRSEVTGDKQPKPQAEEVKEEDSNIVDIRKLAGLK